MKALFITEKWCDGIPSKGITNNYHNLFSTFKNANPDIKFSIIHLDEVALKLGTHIDNLIADTVENVKPEIVIFSLLGNSSLNPTKYTFKFLKNKNIKMIFMWADVTDMYGKKDIEQDLVEYSSLHVCWGSEKNLRTDSKVLWAFAPQDERLYYPSHQTIDVSFVGSIRYPERVNSLQYLLDKKFNLNIKGGQREEGLSAEMYSNYIRTSKINLNFPEGPNGTLQCKGRVWEVLASKSLLIERINNATTQHLIPGTHYVAYTDLQDLERKIIYYLNNENERLEIAKNGYQLYKDRYTYKHFWKDVFTNLYME